MSQGCISFRYFTPPTPHPLGQGGRRFFKCGYFFQGEGIGELFKCSEEHTSQNKNLKKYLDLKQTKKNMNIKQTKKDHENYWIIIIDQKYNLMLFWIVIQLWPFEIMFPFIAVVVFKGTVEVFFYAHDSKQTLRATFLTMLLQCSRL